MKVPKADSLKKIAFVAMPFRTKPTGLKPGAGPDSVDYDALWERAVKPALLELDYMPLRADEQAGSVIIKDMLNALVHADLVLADISLDNGNVYYEAGVRHAARQAGCILIKANWARPLFDLRQISQIRYPLDSSAPTQEQYQEVQSILVETIPVYAESVGPVYELVRGVDSPDSYDNQLRERTVVLYEFDTELTSARISAAKGEKEPLRQMLSPERLQQLPKFALKEVVDAVRDNLNWSRLVEVIDSLPATISNEAYMQEQKALALSLGGELPDAIAIFDELIKREGKTCLRLGNLGGMYRRLASSSMARQKTQYLQAAIAAFRDGMSLDLNDYYCSHKLLVTLVERDRKGDQEEAKTVSSLLDAACQRAVNVRSDDEWLAPTLLIHAFYRKDVEEIREYADLVSGQSWSNWQLIGLLADLFTILKLPMDSDLTKEIESKSHDEDTEFMLEICREIRSDLPVEQELLMSKILPQMDRAENVYRKQGEVEARLAIEGEEIISITDSGEEASQHAREGEIVVRNNTDAKEVYLVEAEVFEKRYDSAKPVAAEFQYYEAAGKSLAFEIDHEMSTLLGVGAEFYIIAPWGTEQYAQEGDYFVCPLPEKGEIYRVGKPEFESTYVAV